jgi:hypothetical protein
VLLDDYAVLLEVLDESVDPFYVCDEVGQIGQDDAAVKVGDDLGMAYLVARDPAELKHPADHNVEVLRECSICRFALTVSIGFLDV